MLKIFNDRECFYQWDLNQKLIVNEDSVTEVHFCNKTDDCSLVCEVYEQDGARLVNVPAILLQSDWTIRAYAYCTNHTVKEKRFKVRARTKPADYVYIDAINQGEIINTASELAIAVSNGVGLSGAASENFVTQNTEAYVANESQITIIENNSGTSTADSNSSDGNSTNNDASVVNGISIKAQGNFKSLPVVVGAGVGSIAAGGGAHAYMDFEGNTSAYVGDDATINAGKKLEILAENDLAVTVGEGAAAGSKYVSGNGAIGLVDVDNSTYAWIGKQSSITAQADGITVKADDYTKVETYNETLGGSQYASVGAAVQVNNISKETQAYVKEAAVLNSKGNVVINAESSEDLFNNAQSFNQFWLKLSFVFIMFGIDLFISTNMSNKLVIIKTIEKIKQYL